MSECDQNNKIAPLTSLRFFAAMMIVNHHVNAQFALISKLPQVITIEQSAQGVTLFFVLSGFILTTVYRAKLQSEGIARFVWKRIARIWPLHVTTLSLKVLLLPVFCIAPGIPWLSMLAAQLLMVHAWIPNRTYFFSFNTPSWSISTEFFFYLFFPFLLSLLNKRWWLPLTVAMAMTASVVSVASIFRLDALTTHGLVYISPLSRILEFALGMTVASLYLRIPVHRVGGAKHNLLWTFCEVFALVIAIVLMHMNSHLMGTVKGLNTEVAHWLCYSGLPMFGFAFLIFVLAVRRGLVSKFLSAPPLVLMGEISFSIYLCHEWLFVYQKNYLPKMRADVDLVAYLSVLFLVSFLLYTLIEKPCRKFMVSAAEPLRVRGRRKGWALTRSNADLETSAERSRLEACAPRIR